jgi:hypothetical protein
MESGAWLADDLGLVYHFPENYELEEAVKREAEKWKQKYETPPATEPQIKYLKTLLSRAGYNLKVEYEELTIDEAGQLISFFVDDTNLSDDLFKRLLNYDV